MRPLLRLVLLVTFLTAGILSAAPAAIPASAETLPPALPPGCEAGVINPPAIWASCIPDGWNGDLVLYAHGYTAFNEPLGLQNLDFGGQSVPGMVLSMKYAFATSSYPMNGLAILPGVDDMKALAEYFWSHVPVPRGHTYLVGVSEGGLVTALALERHPDTFSGGLAACGPIGDFGKQVNYFGDFRVLFDYFFPRQLPPSPIQVPQDVIDRWYGYYEPRVENNLATHPQQTTQLIRTSKAAIDLAHPATSAVESSLGVLWYDVFATNDARDKLGGNPYGNSARIYTGSNNDWLLNRKVQRFQADATALSNLKNYLTSGRLSVPMVTLHTLGDPIIPFWHELLYAIKFRPATPGGSLTPIPVNAYGHCAFTNAQVVGAFGVLVQRVTGQLPANLPYQFNLDQARQDFSRAQREMKVPQ